MIVRIMGGGQFEVGDEQMAAMNELDAAIEADFRENDGAGYKVHLDGLLTIARAGRPLAVDEFETSDVVLPPEDAGLEDVRVMMAQDGLVPG